MIQQQVHEPHDDFADAKDAFWKIVRDTLVEIHGLSVRVASDRVRTVRKRTEARATPGHLSITYHAEPFDVACRLAGQDVRWEDHRDAYVRVVARHDLDAMPGVAVHARRSPDVSP